MNLRIRLHLYVVFLFITGGNICAQSTNISDWHLEASFSIVDENQNGLLTQVELGKFSTEFGWFLKPENYNHANLNLDKGLDMEEFSGYVSMAEAYRKEQETWSLKSLNKKYPYFKKAKAKYFKRHPELAIALLGNLTWARKNIDIVERLASDRKWLNEHPKAILALHTNLTWLVENPQVAYKFYQHKETKSYLPHFDNWRTEHTSLIRKNGKKAEPITTKQSYASRSKSANAEILKLKQQLHSRNAKLQEQNSQNQKQKAIIDSLQKSNQNFARQVKLLNQEVYVIKDSLKQDLDKITIKEPEDLNTVAELKKQVRYMKIEKQLARIEEDSLLAENIRFKKKVNNLEKQLSFYTDTDPGLSENDELEKLQDQLNHVLTELAAKEKEEQTAADSIFTAYQDLNDKYDKLTDAYEKALQEKKKVLMAFEESLKEQENKSTNLEELSFAGSQQQIKLQNDLFESKQRAQIYKQRYDSLLVMQENKDWEISDLKQKKVLLQTQIEALEMEKSQTVDLTPPKADETELLQENIKLESQIARMERLHKEEKQRRAAEKDSLLAQMDQLHMELVETKSTLSLLESFGEVDSSTLNWFKKAQEGYNKQLARYEIKIDELQYDNQKLHQQLEIQIKESTEKEKALTSELEESRKIAMRLNNRNQKLKKHKNYRPLSSKVNDMIVELEEAQQKVINLSKENQAMRDQLETNFTYLSQQLKQQKKLEREVNDYTAYTARLANQNDSLSKQIKKQQTFVDWTDSMQYYRRIITDIEERMQKQQYYYDNEKVSHEQKVDSLVEEIVILQNQKKQLSNSRQVSVEQIESIEARRRKLINDQNKFRERNQILIRKEAVIQKKLQDLARKEKKYQNLLEMEKQLKLREQRLKAKGG
jgi:hypothetical protein